MNTNEEQAPPRVAVPADVDAPDRIAWGLTARQLAILAVAGTVGYSLQQLAAPFVPGVVLAGLAVPAAGLLLAVVLGRRDGIGLDMWLAAAWRHRRSPRLQTPTTPADHNQRQTRLGRRSRAGGQLVHTTGRPPVPAPLHLPADAVGDDGVLHLPGGRHAAVVACGTVNLGLRTGAEQAALVTGFGRWLNSLGAPAQIVVATRRVDLDAHARELAEHAAGLPHPALAAAAAGHARYLAELATSRDPLRRQVLAVVHAEPGQPPAAATRRGQATARALAGLGVAARVLDGAAVVAALSAAVDPYSRPVAGGRATPQTVITTTSSTTVP